MLFKCREACYMPGFGIVRPGTTIDVPDGAEIPRLKTNFVPLDAECERKEREEKELDGDYTHQAKLQRLKDMKVKVPPRATKAEVDRLFAENVEKVELPTKR